MDVGETKASTGDARTAGYPLPPMAALVGLLAMAAMIRLWGIDWGLPSSTHYFSYHPDETDVLLHAMSGFNLFSGKLLPHWYHYGSLQLFLINLANTLVYVFGGIAKISPLSMDFSRDYESWARMTLVGRFLAAAMGTWTVGLAYGIGTRLWNLRVGVFAGILMAVIPLHVQHSHWLTVDVPATFWIMLAVYWAVRLSELHNPTKSTEDQRGRAWRLIKPALWAGAAAGFATATKYNAALAMLPVLHAALPLGRGKPNGPSTRQSVAWASVAVGAFIVAFLIGCPGSVLDTPTFVHDVAFEAKHVSAQPDEPFQQTGNGFVYQITTNLYYGMGLPLLLLSMASLVYAAFRRQRQDGLLAVFAFPYYALIGFAAVRYARYAMPLLPFLTLWSARLLNDLIAAKSRYVSLLGSGLALVVWFASMSIANDYVRPMEKVDPRDRAYQWLNSNGYATQPVGFATMPWFYTPPVEPDFGWSGRGGWISLPFNYAGWQSRVDYRGKDWDMTVLDVDKPPVVVLSQYEYKDAIRLRKPAALTFLTTLQRDYRVGAEFGGGNDPKIGPSGPPHDMMYSNPATWVFVRR